MSSGFENLGLKIDRLPRKLVRARTLEELEGDVLVEYKVDSKSGTGIYLEKWCQTKNNMDRFLLVRSDHRLIAEYLSKKICLNKLLTINSDNVGYFVDRKKDGVHELHQTFLTGLKEPYLPKLDVYHDESLRPKWKKTQINFLIESEWDAILFADIEKQIQNIYGFAYNTDLKNKVNLPEKILNYDYDSGFSYGNCFKRIRSITPVASKGKSVGLSAHSPGILTLEIETSLYNKVQKVFGNLTAATEYLKIVKSWSTTRPQNCEQIPEDSYSDLEVLCDALDINIKSLFPKPNKEVSKPTSNKNYILAAAKIVVSYTRRINSIINKNTRYQFLNEYSHNTSVVEYDSNLINADDDDEV